MASFPLVTVKVTREHKYKAHHVVTVVLTPEAVAACQSVDAPSPLVAYARGGRMPCTGAPCDYVSGAEDRPLATVTGGGLTLATGGLTFTVPFLEHGDTPQALAERVVRWARKVVSDTLSSVPTPYTVEITR